MTFPTPLKYPSTLLIIDGICDMWGGSYYVAVADMPYTEGFIELGTIPGCDALIVDIPSQFFSYKESVTLLVRVRKLHKVPMEAHINVVHGKTATMAYAS